MNLLRCGKWQTHWPLPTYWLWTTAATSKSLWEVEPWLGTRTRGTVMKCSGHTIVTEKRDLRCQIYHYYTDHSRILMLYIHVEIYLMYTSFSLLLLWTEGFTCMNSTPQTNKPLLTPALYSSLAFSRTLLFIFRCKSIGVTRKGTTQKTYIEHWLVQCYIQGDR